MENRNWKEYKIKDVGTVITGKTPSKNNPEDWGDEMPFVTPSDYKHYRKFAKFSDRNLSSIGIERLKSKVLPINSILVTCIGSDMGKIVINKCSVITNQQINSIIPNNNINSDFLYYRLISMYETLRIYGGDGTAVPIINKGDFENLEIQIPPLPEQKAIASVLSNLDDKIDLLHQQNQTLEALAETLYLDFIGEREFNSKLSDIFYLQNGYAFKSKSFKESGTIRVIKIKNISGDIVDITNSDFVDDESIKKLDFKFKINSGDILIAMTGAEVGKLGIVPETDQSLWLNQRVGLLKEKFEGAKYLAYLHLKSDFGQDYIENTATGSAQPNISGEGIENCEFPLYEETELREICNKLSPLYDKVIFNLGQIHTLTQMRDTLLPKLMSGEVRVKM